MKKFILTNTLLLAIFLHACTQSTIEKTGVGGRCEGCEAIYETPIPFELLPNFIQLPDWHEDSIRIAINGIVYKADGKTPAAGIILYIYHTDQTGIYPTRGDEKGWGKRHGYIRGWMKTNEKGEYKFGTRIPVAYPGRINPAHIHIIVKEPGMNPYYIDDFLFDKDPLLTQAERSKLQNRGGNGILIIPKAFDTLSIKKAERDIYLGKNIPNY